MPGAATVTGTLERVLQQDGSPRQALTWEQRQALIPGFEADIRLLEVITGEDFSDWLQPRGDSGGLVGARPAGQRQARNGRPRPFRTACCERCVRSSASSASAELGAQLVRPVRPGHLVVVTLPGIAKVVPGKDAQVAEAPRPER